MWWFVVKVEYTFFSAFFEIFKNDNFFGQIINIGSNNEISIREIIDKISSILKINVDIEQEDIRQRPIKSEVSKLVCDNNKILSQSKWKPKIDFDEGL